MDEQLKERKACRKVGREYVKEEWSDKGVYFEDARVYGQSVAFGDRSNQLYLFAVDPC